MKNDQDWCLTPPCQKFRLIYGTYEIVERLRPGYNDENIIDAVQQPMSLAQYLIYKNQV